MLYRAAYVLMTPFNPLLKHMPSTVTTTEQLGRAMLVVVRHGFVTRVLETADINTL